MYCNSSNCADLVIALSITLFAACTSVVKVESVEINKATLSMIEGGSETLTAKVLPEDARYKTIILSTSEASVATVDEASGLVTAIASTIPAYASLTIDGAISLKQHTKYSWVTNAKWVEVAQA